MSQHTQGPIGVAAALASLPPTRTAFSQFLLLGRVAMVTGGHRGFGLDMALVLAEAGAIVYCIDLASQPNQDWLTVQKYAKNLPDIEDANGNGKGRLEYVQGDVTDQAKMWKIAENIVEKEGRIDICIANAGILESRSCLEYSDKDFKKVLDVNTNGSFFAAQAAGRQMDRLGIRGSIIMVASMVGSIALQGFPSTAYGTSKAAILQMARSMACELGPKGIRVNTISPGYTTTRMVLDFTDVEPEVEGMAQSQNPLGRLATPDEIRGLALWLASDASSFCTGSDIIIDGGHRAW